MINLNGYPDFDKNNFAQYNYPANPIEDGHFAFSNNQLPPKLLSTIPPLPKLISTNQQIPKLISSSTNDLIKEFKSENLYLKSVDTTASLVYDSIIVGFNGEEDNKMINLNGYSDFDKNNFAQFNYPANPIEDNQINPTINSSICTNDYNATNNQQCANSNNQDSWFYFDKYFLRGAGDDHSESMLQKVAQSFDNQHSNSTSTNLIYNSQSDSLLKEFEEEVDLDLKPSSVELNYHSSKYLNNQNYFQGHYHLNQTNHHSHYNSYDFHHTNGDLLPTSNHHLAPTQNFQPNHNATITQQQNTQQYQQLNQNQQLIQPHHSMSALFDTDAAFNEPKDKVTISTDAVCSEPKDKVTISTKNASKSSNGSSATADLNCGNSSKRLITLKEAASVKLEKVKIERANGMKIYYFKCSLCTYQTNTSQSMKDHLYCIHCKAKNNYKCNICHQTFGWKNNAQRHMRRKHKIEDQITKREAIITLI